MCSNEYILVFLLANLDFRGYVRSGRWVGEVSQTMYTCAKKKGKRRIGAVNQYHSVRHYFSHLTRTAVAESLPFVRRRGRRRYYGLSQGTAASTATGSMCSPTRNSALHTKINDSNQQLDYRKVW